MRKRMSKSQKKRLDAYRRELKKSAAELQRQEESKRWAPVEKKTYQFKVGAQVKVAFINQVPFEYGVEGEVLSNHPHLIIKVDFSDNFREMVIPYTSISAAWTAGPEEDEIILSHE